MLGFKIIHVIERGPKKYMKMLTLALLNAFIQYLKGLDHLALLSRSDTDSVV